LQEFSQGNLSLILSRLFFSMTGIIVYATCSKLVDHLKRNILLFGPYIDIRSPMGAKLETAIHKKNSDIEIGYEKKKKKSFLIH